MVLYIGDLDTAPENIVECIERINFGNLKHLLNIFLVFFVEHDKASHDLKHHMFSKSPLQHKAPEANLEPNPDYLVQEHCLQHDLVFNLPNNFLNFVLSRVSCIFIKFLSKESPFQYLGRIFDSVVSIHVIDEKF